MIKIKLKEISQSLDKTITDIAEETGLNRNTITALYHNKVDGIKFDTIEKICGTYNLSLDSLIEIEKTRKESPEKDGLEENTIQHPYKQEGDIVLFTSMPPFLQAHYVSKKYFEAGAGTRHIGFYKKNYGMVYWDKDDMDKAAEAYFKRYSNEKNFDELFESFVVHAKALERLYREHSKKEIMSYDDQQIISFSQKIWDTYAGFWQLGVFIDTFDAGYDVKKIDEIKEKYHLTEEELAILTTPEEMTFGNQRLLSLLEIVKKMARKNHGKSKIRSFVENSAEVRKYITDYDYYTSNYAHINHISIEDVSDEVEKILKEKKWKDEYAKLVSYGKNSKRDIARILREHKLKKNPLFLFQKLIFWREYRKQINLMGIHLMHYLLYSIEEKTGIPYEYLKSLTFDEVPNVVKGLISKDQLRKRSEEGVIFSVNKGKYKIIEGPEAISIKEELEQKVKGQGEAKIITGRVACQGYAKGIARIIFGQEDFHKFNEGEILITGMTRPEFVPLMKKAAAIVTNEGGITCHAAIVSRELGKPCIIGTQRATQLIKDGDLIEVRANHGTIRILS